MYRILLSLLLLPLLLLYAGATLACDEPADSAALIGNVAEAVEVTDGSGHAVDSDDSALVTSDRCQPLLSLESALRRPSPSDIPNLNHPGSALIRAPPFCLC